MVRIKDPKQQHLFDPWDFLSPKRRKMLDESWPGLFRQHILEQLPVDDFALLFDECFGRPTKELYTVLGALLLQQCFDLTDPQAVEQLAYNIQWHYALNITEESDSAKYLCEKTLWSMRQFATALALHNTTFENTTAKLADVFSVNDDKQRLDSVHIRSNMRRLGRIGIFVTGIDTFLRNLQRQHKPLWESIDEELVTRYQGSKARQCFGLVKPSQSAKTLSEVASDLYRLVVQFENHPEVADMYSFKQLRRIVNEQCDVAQDGASVAVKQAKEVRSDSLQNPSDPDATYSGHKGQGYQVQIMETYSSDDDKRRKQQQLNLITHVAVQSACESDANALEPAIDDVQKRQMAPDQLLADTLYGSDRNHQTAKAEDIELVAPVHKGNASNTNLLAGFSFNDSGYLTQCPAGHDPERVRYKKKTDRYSAAFTNGVCRRCPGFGLCQLKEGKNHYFLHYSGKQCRLAVRRAAEKKDAFTECYRWRAGVEATMSELDRRTGIKNLRVRGKPAVRFAATMKAAGLNLLRAGAVRKARRKAAEAARRSSKSIYLDYMAVKERILGLVGQSGRVLANYSHLAANEINMAA